ncbi:hypothetical protein HDU76_011913, partial [Blyttiomyces sp. JEL0837]
KPFNNNTTNERQPLLSANSSGNNNTGGTTTGGIGIFSATISKNVIRWSFVAVIIQVLIQGLEFWILKNGQESGIDTSLFTASVETQFVCLIAW